MKVSIVQLFLRSLTPGLSALTASAKAVGELEKMAALFEPFNDMDIEAFQVLLTQAEEYRRTGILPVAPQKGGSKAKATPSLDLDSLARKLAELRQRADRREEPYERLEQEWEALGTAKLTVKQWEPIASELAVELPRSGSKTVREKLIREAVFRNYPKPVPPEVAEALSRLREVESFARHQASSEADVEARFRQLALEKLAAPFLRQICDQYQVSYNGRTSAKTLATELLNRVKGAYKARAGLDV